MYISAPDYSTLRQGDVVQDIYYTAPVTHSFTNGTLSLPQQYPIRLAKLAVVSQCCELEWYPDDQGRRRPRRPWVLVAPFTEVLPFDADTLEYANLVKNGENETDNDPVQYFYYSPCDALPSGGVINLATIFPIRNGELDNYRDSKLIQLNVKNRHLLRQRLTDFFGRIPDDEAEEVEKLFGGDAS